MPFFYPNDVEPGAAAGNARVGTAQWVGGPTTMEGSLDTGQYVVLSAVADGPISGPGGIWTEQDSGSAGGLHWARFYALGPGAGPWFWSSSGRIVITWIIFEGAQPADTVWGTVDSGSGDEATAPDIGLSADLSWASVAFWSGVVDGGGSWRAADSNGLGSPWDALPATTPQEATLADAVYGAGPLPDPQSQPFLIGSWGRLFIGPEQPGGDALAQVRLETSGTPLDPGTGGAWVAWQVGVHGSQAAGWGPGRVGWS